MATYRLSNTAEDDLIRIYKYGLENFGAVRAEQYFNAFFNCFDAIVKNPFAFESVDYLKVGYRRCVCGVDTIYYRINAELVEIMTIIGRQDLEAWFSK